MCLALAFAADGEFGWSLTFSATYVPWLICIWIPAAGVIAFKGLDLAVLTPFQLEVVGAAALIGKTITTGITYTASLIAAFIQATASAGSATTIVSTLLAIAIGRALVPWTIDGIGRRTFSGFPARVTCT